MAILRAIDGKFYEVPDNQLESFEVPREKVKDLLAKAGGPGLPPEGAAPGPGQGGPHHGGPHHGAPQGAPTIIQIFPGGQVSQSAPPSGPPPQDGGQGDVDPYWYYRYWVWRNFWPNWGNY